MDTTFLGRFASMVTANHWALLSKTSNWLGENTTLHRFEQVKPYILSVFRVLARKLGKEVKAGMENKHIAIYPAIWGNPNNRAVRGHLQSRIL